MPVRNYSFLELTKSICSHCLKQIDAKVILENDRVYLLKHCVEHGSQKTLVSDDWEYYQLCRSLHKPADVPFHFNTEIKWGCPYDCGLCPDHEQHSCISVVEITDRCNMECPTCYSASGPAAGRHKSLEEVERMLDQVIENEREPDIVQISGGEPTIHPQFFEILENAKARPIRHLMLNTNGIRIAKEKDFIHRLLEFTPGFEIYLQFDSLNPASLKHLRGDDVTDTRREALEKLNEHNISTTLVVTLEHGVNNDEIGGILDFAQSQPCVRGVTFQPKQMAGRIGSADAKKDRYPLSRVRRDILNQCDWLTEKDIIPVPCNPDHIAMAYGIRQKGRIVPLTRYLDPVDLLQGSRNTIVFESQPEIKDRLIQLFSTARSPDSAFGQLKQLLCCLPGIAAPELKYEDVFRVIILEFMDVHNLDVRSLKKSCVHMARPDEEMIPFEVMNILHRAGEIHRLRSQYAKI